MNKRVLVLLSSPIASRTAGVSRYAREHGWHLMFQDRMGFAHPFDWMGDGVIATIDTSEGASVEAGAVLATMN